jgi:hypothetical protein
VERVFFMAGQCGIPVTASALALNVTVTGATAPGYVVFYPGGSPVPLASTVNFRAAQTRANNAIVRLGPAGTLGAISGQSTGTVHVIVDVTGYFE